MDSSSILTPRSVATKNTEHLIPSPKIQKPVTIERKPESETARLFSGDWPDGDGMCSVEVEESGWNRISRQAQGTDTYVSEGVVLGQSRLADESRSDVLPKQHSDHRGHSFEFD